VTTASLLATVLALGAAVLHAGWNLAAKQSGDRFLALWGQFVVAGAISCVALAVWWIVDLPGIAWGWAVLSGIVHVPYLALLAASYDRGDFSLAYPIARGGGALLAAVGGVMLLDDALSPVSALGIALAASGLAVLGFGRGRVHLGTPLLVAASIGTYTLIDSAGARRSDDGAAYALAVFACIGVACALWAVMQRRWRDVVAWARAAPGRTAGTGAAAVLTYGMVMLAVQRAPVGYVAALRESSVVLAAYAGWRVLDEGDHRRRLASSVVVLAGLILLIAGA
jgi:drug/metabolite transporter (DMT)-like permease